MFVPILLINAGIVGVALVMGLVSLLYGITFRQWRTVGLFAFLSVVLTIYALGVIGIGASPEAAQAGRLLRICDLVTFAFFGLLPLLYRHLSGQRGRWPEFGIQGLYTLLLLAALMVPNGLGWKSIRTVAQVDLGWLGRPYQPVLEGTWATAPLYALHLLVILYCVALTWKAWRKGLTGISILLVLPLLMVGTLAFNAGVMLRFWRPVPINAIAASFLYMGLGLTVLTRFRALLRERDELFEHLSEREARLRASEERFRQLFDGAADALMLWDRQGHLVDANQAACQSLGYSLEELRRQKPGDLEPGLGDAAFEERWARIEQEDGLAEESLHQRRDGSRFPVDLHIIPFQQGELSLLFTAARDISERKAAEAEKAKLEDQLGQAMKLEAIGRLAGGVAHDFNNLLTVILGNIQLSAADLEPDHPAKRNLLNIEKAADAAASLTRQLLAFSRRQMIEPKVVSMNDLITGLEGMLTRLIPEDIAVKIHCGQDLGRVKVDPGQFEQVILNLAINARDAMPKGGQLLIETCNAELGEAYCALHPETRPGSYVQLTVSDSGAGMSEEVRERIFEPFFTTKPKGKGTGLGLAMVFGTVKQLGGAIEVYSELAHGTSFKIYLPVTEEESIWAAPAPQPELVQGHETVLLVEDEESLREVGRRVLERLGYRVFCAASGEEALARFSDFPEPIHLLMTDVVMTGMHGRDLANRWLQLRPDTKVLYASGYTEEVIVHRGVLDAELNFIGKPYSIQGLAQKIRTVLEASSA